MLINKEAEEERTAVMEVSAVEWVLLKRAEQDEQEEAEGCVIFNI